MSGSHLAMTCSVFSPVDLPYKVVCAKLWQSLLAVVACYAVVLCIMEQADRLELRCSREYARHRKPC